MDTARLLRLLDAGDMTAWPDLARDLERRTDAQGAAQALALLHAQGHAEAAAQWLAHVTDTPTLQTLRAQVLAQSQGWSVGKLRALTKDLLSGDFRLIPAGSFVMGSSDDEEGREDDEDDEDKEKQHLVEITRPFLLKTTPVTQAEWLALMGDNPSKTEGDDRRPVEQVSWEDTARFCDALSAQTGGTYSRPTEAQWEYACRAGTTTTRYGDLANIAWYMENAHHSPQPVAQKQPNAWGLYDMLGNVWEWCQDRYLSDASRRQPHTQGSPRLRVFRGGACSLDARYCRAAQRGYNMPAFRSVNVGFRPAGLVI
jgi:formylglycine-generating enzyme required for sulfatase activity